MENNIDLDTQNFIKFMKAHIILNIDNTTKITHTLMGPLHPTDANFRGKYNIEGLDYEKFMKLYKLVICKIDMHIVERPNEVGPMVIDIDFKTNNKYKERQYLDEHIEYIVEKYNRLFNKYLYVNKKEIKAFVFEKPSPTHDPIKKEYKDGFHIMYPEIPLNVKQRYFFFDKVKKEIINENGFTNIPFINSYEEILDSSVIINNGILMYGSHKEYREPYSLTKIYNNNMSIDSLDNYEDDNELISYLSIRRYCQDDAYEFINEESEVEEIYKNYLNGNANKKNKEKNKNINDEINEEKMKEIIELVDKEISPNELQKQADIKIAILLCKKVLSKKRATIYNDWIRVGWTLYNISPTLLPTFIEFSKKCPEKYENGCCEKIWKSANSSNSGYTIASLHWWARNDDLDSYLTVMREIVKDLILKAESGTHDDIANIVKEMYKHQYKCVNISQNIWYEFQENKWTCIDSAYTLKEKISNELTREFCLLFSYYFREASENQTIENDDSFKKFKRTGRTYEKLKTTGFVKCVIEQCSHKFYEKKFEEKLNTNPYLLGFENGVYDLKNMCFRKGCPDDMVSITVGYDYIEYDENDKDIKEIEDYFIQVQREEDMRKYILQLISSFLDGRIIDQKFVLWTGSGCHAKNEEIQMLDYSCKKIQNIKLHDNVLGADGRKRRVVATYNGTGTMYDILIKDVNNTKFTVNENHRLALSCHFKPYIYITYDEIYEKNIYWISHHEMIDDGPTNVTTKFYTEIDANNFLIELNENPNVIQYEEIIPVNIKRLLYVNDDIMQYYKIPHYNSDRCNDSLFTIIKLDEPQDFYGIELDGDKKYVMKNGYITYNSNGKSTTIDLIHNTLGEYAGVLPVTILTHKRGSSSAAVPELADKRGKRFLVIQEPEHDDTVYVGQMKELTAGNDKIHARALYGDPFTYKPQFKLILICNKLPHIPASDGGTWRRLRVTPWETEFVDKPKESHQFKKDPKLQEKMEKWNQPFVWLLLNKYYPDYIKNGLIEPAKVTKYTNAYKKDSDVYLEFFTEYIKETNNVNDVEKIEYMFSLFKSWYKEAYSEKHPPKKEFSSYLEKKGLSIVRGLVSGVKIIIPGDDYG